VALGLRADWAPVEAPKAYRERIQRNGNGSPSPVHYGVWGSVVNEVRDSAPDKNGFGTFYLQRTHMMATNCLEYGITVNNVSVHTGIEKGTGTLKFMVSTGVRS